MALFNDKEWQKLISTWNFSWLVAGLVAQAKEDDINAKLLIHFNEDNFTNSR